MITEQENECMICRQFHQLGPQTLLSVFGVMSLNSTCTHCWGTQHLSPVSPFPFEQWKTPADFCSQVSPWPCSESRENSIKPPRASPLPFFSCDPCHVTSLWRPGVLCGSRPDAEEGDGTRKLPNTDHRGSPRQDNPTPSAARGPGPGFQTYHALDELSPLTARWHSPCHGGTAHHGFEPNMPFRLLPLLRWAPLCGAQL